MANSTVFSITADTKDIDAKLKGVEAAAREAFGSFASAAKKATEADEKLQAVIREQNAVMAPLQARIKELNALKQRNGSLSKIESAELKKLNADMIDQKRISKLVIDQEKQKVAEYKRLKASQRAYLSDLKTVKSELVQHSNATGKHTAAMKSNGSGVSALVTRIGGLAAAYFSVRSASEAVIANGIRFNAQIETMQIGIASLISVNSENVTQQGKVLTQQEKFNMAMGQSGEVIGMLRKANLETSATLTQLAQGFQATAGPALKAGMSIAQTVEYTKLMTQAAGAMGLPMDQLAQEMRSVVSGTIDVNSVVAKNIGITNEQIQAAKESGDLYGFLAEKLSGFAESGKVVADSWDGSMSNMEDGWDSLAGALTEPIFDALKDDVQELGVYFSETAIKVKDFFDQFKRVDELSGLDELNKRAVKLYEDLAKAKSEVADGTWWGGRDVQAEAQVRILKQQIGQLEAAYRSYNQAQEDTLVTTKDNSEEISKILKDANDVLDPVQAKMVEINDKYAKQYELLVESKATQDQINTLTAAWAKDISDVTGESEKLGKSQDAHVKRYEEYLKKNQTLADAIFDVTATDEEMIRTKWAGLLEGITDDKLLREAGSAMAVELAEAMDKEAKDGAFSKFSDTMKESFREMAGASISGDAYSFEKFGENLWDSFATAALTEGNNGFFDRLEGAFNDGADTIAKAIGTVDANGNGNGTALMGTVSSVLGYVAFFRELSGWLWGNGNGGGIMDPNNNTYASEYHYNMKYGKGAIDFGNNRQLNSGYGWMTDPSLWASNWGYFANPKNFGSKESLFMAGYSTVNPLAHITGHIDPISAGLMGGLFGRTKAYNVGLQATGLDADSGGLQSVTHYTKKSWTSKKAWDVYKNVDDEYLAYIQGVVGNFNQIVGSAFDELVDISIADGRYKNSDALLNKGIAKGIISSIMGQFESVNVGDIWRDVGDRNAVYDTWVAFTKDAGGTVLEAMQDALGGYVQFNRSFEEWLYEFNGDATGLAAFRASYTQSDLDAIMSAMGVSGVNVDNYLSMREQAIEMNFSPETIEQWDTLGQALMANTEAQEANSALLEAQNNTTYFPDMMLGKVSDRTADYSAMQKDIQMQKIIMADVLDVLKKIDKTNKLAAAGVA